MANKYDALIQKLSAEQGHSSFRAALSGAWRGGKDGWKDQSHHNSKAQDAASKADDAAGTDWDKGDRDGRAAYDDYWKKYKSEKKSSLMDRIISDFTKGASRNPRLGNVQMGGPGQETKVASAGLTHLDVAKLAGVLRALDEGGFSLKEACAMTGHPEDILREVLETVR